MPIHRTHGHLMPKSAVRLVHAARGGREYLKEARGGREYLQATRYLQSVLSMEPSEDGTGVALTKAE